MFMAVAETFKLSLIFFTVETLAYFAKGNNHFANFRKS